MTQAEIKSWMLNQLSHPGTPIRLITKKLTGYIVKLATYYTEGIHILKTLCNRTLQTEICPIYSSGPGYHGGIFLLRSQQYNVVVGALALEIPAPPCLSTMTLDKMLGLAEPHQ